MIEKKTIEIIKEEFTKTLSVLGVRKESDESLAERLADIVIQKSVEKMVELSELDNKKKLEVIADTFAEVTLDLLNQIDSSLNEGEKEEVLKNIRMAIIKGEDLT